MGSVPTLDNSTRDALEELSLLLSYLRWWNLEKQISIDALMPPPETYYKGLFFQVIGPCCFPSFIYFSNDYVVDTLCRHIHIEVPLQAPNAECLNHESVTITILEHT